MELIFDKGEFIPTYQQEHFAVVEWLRKHPLLRSIFMHVPQGKLSAKKRIIGPGSEVKYIYLDDIRLRKMGIRAGMFNFFIPLANKHYHGLWIELKRKKNLLLSIDEKRMAKANARTLLRGRSGLWERTFC